MKHKTIAEQSAHLLAAFHEQGQACFTHEDALNLFPETKRGTVLELLSDMTRRGLLMRVKKGVYYIIPYEQNAETFLPNWHVLASVLLKQTPRKHPVNYYIGYYSALEIHSLITQPALSEQVVVDRQIKPTTLTIKDVRFQFIYHNPRHFFGATPIWVDTVNKLPCSDLEKTLLDCFFKPENAGGIVEVAKALYNTQDAINYEKLLAYIQRFQSQAVIKRLGYVLELFDIQHPIVQELQHLKTASLTRLDPALPKVGKMISRWSLQVNVDPDTLHSAVMT